MKIQIILCASPKSPTIRFPHVCMWMIAFFFFFFQYLRHLSRKDCLNILKTTLPKCVMLLKKWWMGAGVCKPQLPYLGSWQFLSTTCIPEWRRQWHPTPVLLPGKSHGQRSLVGCSPWGRKESDTTERLHFHFSLLRVGEGNGNPLQCSCLENPRDGGAWWAAVYRVGSHRLRHDWSDLAAVAAAAWT